MTRHFSNVGIYWQRTVLLALVFICTVLIIYQIDPSYDLNDSKVEFYEDFGDKASKKEVLINSDSENKENSLDLPVEAEKVLEPTPVYNKPESTAQQPEILIQQEQITNQNSANEEIPVSVSKDSPSDVRPDSIIDSAIEGIKVAASPPPQQENSAETSVTISETSEEPMVSLPSVQEHSITSIPKIIHQIAPSEILPIVYQPLIESCLTQNAGWQYYMWRDQDRDAFLEIRYPHHADWFSKLSSRQQQDQLFRFFVLQVYGGIYLDTDMECLKPMESLLTNISLFVGAERPELSKIVRNVDQSADITAVAGAPGHKVFSNLIEQLSSLPTEPVDVSSLLTTAFDAYSKSVSSDDPKVNCTLRDYHYFGPALNWSFPWNDFCKELLRDNLPSDATPSEQQGFEKKRQGCIELRQKNWTLLELSEDTLAVHRYSNLNLANSNENLFNLTQQYPDRVTFYRTVGVI
uniref:Alpha-1,4-N-acetylglucosaminyltransferase n=2 Tax=Macrostomum lignano TaxID=282301 RepID=A0A1I8I8R5_9PLAT